MTETKGVGGGGGGGEGGGGGITKLLRRVKRNAKYKSLYRAGIKRNSNFVVSWNICAS